MKIIRNKILDCLYSFSKDDEKLIHEINAIIEECGNKTYPLLFHVLTHLDLDEEEAQTAWQEICQHRTNMSSLLGHSVNLRTAICDYFCSIHKSLTNPKVVELHIFENTFSSAKFDKLTGLYNRAYFDESLLREISRAKRYDSVLSLLFLDIDNFKLVNDNYGHLAGDYVLKDLSQAILDTIRSQDIAARYGGEEIVIILPQTTKMTALILAERIRELIENLSLQYDGDEIHITLSGGLATFPLDTEEPDELVKFADMALFKAKASGKNNILPYSANKRRYIRIDFLTDIMVKQISMEKCPGIVKASTKNISLSGILFKSQQSFTIGTKLQLQIPFDFSNQTIVVLGTVVRVEFLQTDDYEIGISFFDLESSSKNEISQYLLKNFTKKLS